ncbi:glycosyltransferase (plasmid) [Telmatobacter bradus]|uniref:glycosyltransferase n=1 Tax=Telmatobacter bradus TaxID=474953 RepID=UPI003B43874E
MPAYREAEALRKFLPMLVSSVKALSESSEILVADSMLPLDDTKEVCAQYGVRHIYRMGGNAYGDAVRTGIDNSLGRYVLLMDADGSHNPGDLARLWNMRNEYDIVIGSRYIKGGSTENPAVLIWMSRILNYIYRFAFRLKISDVSNSFRLYKGEQLRSLKLQSSDFEIVEEILIRLTFGSSKATVTEVPVTFEQRKAGKSKRNLPAFMVKYLGSIMVMRKYRSAELKNGKRRG